MATRDSKGGVLALSDEGRKGVGLNVSGPEGGLDGLPKQQDFLGVYLNGSGNTIKDPAQNFLDSVPNALAVGDKLLEGDGVFAVMAAARGWGEDLMDHVEEGSAVVAERCFVRQLEEANIVINEDVGVVLDVDPGSGLGGARATGAATSGVGSVGGVAACTPAAVVAALVVVVAVGGIGVVAIWIAPVVVGGEGAVLEDEVPGGWGLVGPSEVPLKEALGWDDMGELLLGCPPRVVDDFTILEAEPGGVLLKFAPLL